MTEWLQATKIYAAAERLRQVQLECDDAIRIIDRFDSTETLFYVDPPYPTDTRNERWAKTAYAEELAGSYHTHLANALQRIKGHAVVSSYPNDPYDEFYSGWERRQRQTTTMNRTAATEVLYIHPRTSESLKSRP